MNNENKYITIDTERGHWYVRFEQTCGACPEQYDVFIDVSPESKSTDICGYVRLRWGYLRVDCPDCGGETVYEHEFDDGLMGCFDNNHQRTTYLVSAAKAIVEYAEKREWI